MTIGSDRQSKPISFRPPYYQTVVSQLMYSRSKLLTVLYKIKSCNTKTITLTLTDTGDPDFGTSYRTW